MVDNSMNKDITKTGKQTYKDLQNINEEPYAKFSPDFQEVIKGIKGRNQYASPYDSNLHGDQLVQSPLSNTDTPWGESIFDNKTANVAEFENLGNVRAENQPAYTQLAAGLTKGAVLAGTTFADGIIGTIVGLGNAAATGTFSGFWDNPFSNKMQSINEWSEKALPNYYTDAERNDPWYEHIFTANFIGDKLIKNAGFMIGAAYSGKMYSTGMAKALGLNKARQAFKGLTTASGEAVSPKAAMAAYASGDATLDGLKLTQELVKDAKKLKNAEPILKMTGALTGAMGEARIEAVQNSKDWFDLHKQQLDDAQALITNQEEAAIFQEFPQFTTQQLSEDGKSLNRVLTPEGQELLKARVAAKFDYNGGLQKLAESRVKMGNRIFALEVPLLSIGDFWQFGKFYTGGYNTARKGSQILKSVATDGTVSYSAAKPSMIRNAAKVASKGIIEGPYEEMGQATISKATGYKYASELNDFYGAKIDPDAERETTDWLNAFSNAITDTYGTAKGWEEGFIGGLMGMIGVPTFRSFKKAEGGMQSPITFQGGIREDIKEIKEQNRADDAIIEQLNNRVQSPEFLNYYQSIIRHNTYQRNMDDATENGDNFEFKNAEHNQLINDVIMFDKAGRINDLYDIIEEAGTVKPEDVDKIRELTANKETGKSIYSDKTDDEVIEHIQKQTKETKESVDTYRKISEDLKTKIGDNFTEDGLEEMTYYMSNIDNLENRFKSLHENVKNRIQSVLEATNDEEFKSDEEDDEVIKLSNLLTYSPFRLLNELSNSKEAQNYIKLVDALINNDPNKQDIINELNDLDKIASKRIDFITKYNTYLDNPQALQQKQDKQKEVVIEKANQDAVNNTKAVVSKAVTLREFREALNNEPDAANKQKVLDELEKENNKFVKPYKEVQSYYTELNQAIEDLNVTPESKTNIHNLLEAQFNAANSLEEIANPNSDIINNPANLYDINLSDEQNMINFADAQYSLNLAMNKVNNDQKFKARFPKEFLTPVTRTPGTPTKPASVGNGYTIPAGNVNRQSVIDENKNTNERSITTTAFDNKQQGKRTYYRPVIPELHIEASRDGDFRPFNEVVLDREKKDFSVLYDYLRDNGAFNYVNNGNLHVNDELGFMIDPAYESAKTTNKDVVTIFIVDRKNNQIVGSLDESQYSIDKYEGLQGLVDKVRKEYAGRGSAQVAQKDDLIYITNTSQGYSALGKLQEWSIKTADVRTAPDGFGVKNGLTYFKVSHKGGRGGDNVTIWFRNEPSQKIKDIIEQLLNSSKDLNEFGDTLAKFIKDTKSDTVGGSAVALSYLLENGVGTIESAGYFLHAVAAAYPVITDRIESLRNSLAKETLGMKPDTFVASNNPVIAQIGNLINEYYGKEGTNIYQELLKNSTGFVPSVGSKIDNKIEKLIPIRSTQSNTGNRFIATPTTRVSQIMIGKIPYSNEEKSLADIPHVLDGKEEPVLGVIRNGSLVTNTIPDNLIIKPMDMRNKEGRMYLLIPNAAGKYSPAAVRVKHFNSEEFNPEDVNIQSTPLYGKLQEDFKKLATAINDEDVKLAVQSLKSNLYLGDIHIDFFDSKRGVGIRFVKIERDANGNEIYDEIDGKRTRREDLKVVYFSTEGKDDAEVIIEYSDKDAPEEEVVLRGIQEVTKDIQDALLSYNLPLQVNAGMLNKGNYNNYIITSNILTSNISDARVSGSWFTTDYFDAQGNLQAAVNPISTTSSAGRVIQTPVGGKESVIEGTKVTILGITYYVDLTTKTVKDDKGNIITTYPADLLDIAFIQHIYGNTQNDVNMIKGIVLLPNGAVFDRNKGTYLTGSDAEQFKQSLKDVEKRKVDSAKIISSIENNQANVDKTKTDGEFYYVLEEDGQYHEYKRVHSAIGSNWKESAAQATAIDNLKIELAKKADNINEYNRLLRNKANYYNIDLSSFEGKTDVRSRDAVIIAIRDKMSGTNSQRALAAGTSVDSIIRSFFTSDAEIVRPDNMTEEAFNSLLTSLTDIKKNIEDKGEKFLTNNIVLYHKFENGERIAGEVDILSVDANGNFKIYDVKTSRYSFYDFINNHGVTTNYFKNKSGTQFMSSEQYYTKQLSAYKDLFEAQYGTPVTTLAILPFVLSYDKNTVSAVNKEKGIIINYTPTLVVPKTVVPTTPTNVSNNLSIFNNANEALNPINETTPEFNLENSSVGYFIRENALHKSYVTPVGVINGISIHMMKVPNITKGFGNAEAHTASINFYAVLPNGYTIEIIKTAEPNKSESEAKAQIIKVLSGNPNKLIKLANENTIIFNPSSRQQVNTTSTATTTTGGAKSATALEQSLNQIDGVEDILILRKVDDTKTEVWDQEKELAWLNKVLPQLSAEQRVLVVKGLIKVAKSGALAWGQFSKGVITLSDIAAAGTTYHEAFHVVFNTLLNERERASLYTEAKKLYGEKDNLSLEEEMAEGFREYVMSQDGRSLGRRILDFFKELFAKVTNWKYMKPSLAYYYQRINAGSYTNSNIKVLSISESRYRIAESGVSELFESNPELANSIYEALGVDNIITSNDKIVWGHPAIGKTTMLKSNPDAFMDWDNEFNRKRDSWIANKSNTVIGTPEFKKARNKYMINYNNHKDYIAFVTEEWNKAKEKANKENKTLIASPHMLLNLFPSDFDKVITMNDKTFMDRAIRRSGGDEVNSKLWKEGINETLKSVDKSKIIETDKYINDLFITPEQKQQAQQAYSIYKALGFTENIIQDNKSYYRGQIEEPTIDKDGNLILYGREDELYKRAGLKSKGVSMTDNLKSAIDYGNGQLEVAQNLASESYDAEQELYRLLENGYYLIQIPKNISNEVVKEAGEVKVVGDKIIIPKGQYKIEQVVDDLEAQITPEQKQQAQQLYSRYLDTIGVTNISYHHSESDLEGFKKFVKDFSFPNSSLNNLDVETKERLIEKGWTQEKFNSVSQEEREQAIRCA